MLFFFWVLEASLTQLRRERSVSIGKKSSGTQGTSGVAPLESSFDLIEGDHCLVVDPPLRLYSNLGIRQAGQSQ